MIIFHHKYLFQDVINDKSQNTKFLLVFTKETDEDTIGLLL